MTDEPRDDEIIGRALARAIETQYIRETPYDESRIGAPRGRSFAWIWQLAGAAVVLIVGAGMASWLLRPSASQPVAASPTPSASAVVVTTPVPTAPPQSAVPTTSSAPKTQVDHGVVYFPRDGQPPIGVHAAGVATQASAEERIASRVDALNNGSPTGSHIVVPQGAYNPFPLQDPRVLHVLTARVQAQVATVDLAMPSSGWAAPGAARTNALVQQLVYTITEEPGISRAVVLENGKPAVIDQFVWNRPLSREDVFGYSATGPLGVDHAIAFDGAPLSQTGQTSTQTETVIGSAVKATFDLAPGSSSPPSFIVSMAPTRDDLQQMGKYVLTVVIGDSKIPNTPQSTQAQFNDETPLRATLAGRNGQIFVESLLLDDARPWRAYTAGSKVIVEVGGDPRSVSDRIAVFAPAPGQTVSSGFAFSGAARVFEANVSWRVKDSSGNVLASGHVLASVGSSAVWGTFSGQVAFSTRGTAPANVTFEVYEVSPKDGSEQGVVVVPIKSSP